MASDDSIFSIWTQMAAGEKNIPQGLKPQNLVVL